MSGSVMDPMAREVMEWVGASCPCLACLTERWNQRRPGDPSCAYPDFMGVPAMVVCGICGNKRCPHSDHHGNACTGSNNLGQPGSRYAAPPPATTEGEPE